MNEIRQAVLTVCVCAFVSGLCELILPDKSFKSTMRLITGCILIISLLLPFTKGINTDFEIQLTQPSADSGSLESVAAMSAKQAIAERVLKKGIKSATIVVYTDCKENDVSIQKAVILLKNSDIEKGSVAAAECEQSFGFDVSVGEMK